MTKRDAKKLKVGDRVQQLHTVRTFKVLERIDHCDEGRVPLFRCENEADGSEHRITYSLLATMPPADI